MRDEVSRVADVFKALGDTTRLKIIKILASRMSKDLRVGDIADMLGISQPAVSQHLKILKAIGILSSEREGYRIIYNINTEVLKQHKKLVDTVFEMAFLTCEQVCATEGNECAQLKKRQ